MSEPATKDDLDQAMTQLRGEMTGMGEQLRGEMAGMGEQLRGEMASMGEQLRGEMASMGKQLRGEMAEIRGEVTQLRGEVTQLRGEMGDMEVRLSHRIEQSASQVAKEVANIMMEQLRDLVSVVDEKYKDLPRQHEQLRADFDAHAADRRLHTRLPPAPAKRVRRSR